MLKSIRANFQSYFLEPLQWSAPYVIPFSRDFQKCTGRDFREAWIELCVTTFFSTMPLWIMPLLGPIIFKTDVSFADHALSTIKGGELFVYCAALLGPLIYIITRRYGESSIQTASIILFSSLTGQGGSGAERFTAAGCLFMRVIILSRLLPATAQRRPRPWTVDDERGPGRFCATKGPLAARPRFCLSQCV
jgi:hypothetical protein